MGGARLHRADVRLQLLCARARRVRGGGQLALARGARGRRRLQRCLCPPLQLAGLLEPALRVCLPQRSRGGRVGRGLTGRCARCRLGLPRRRGLRMRRRRQPHTTAVHWECSCPTECVRVQTFELRSHFVTC